MQLTIVVAVLNGFEMAAEAIRTMVTTLESPETTELIVFDNGSDTPFIEYLQSLPEMGELRQAIEVLGGFECIRNNGNVGNYPIFEMGLERAMGEVVAYIHSDVFILQDGWDGAVKGQFSNNPKLGLIGFIGSTEIDFFGGRGMGTASNMHAVEWQGKQMSAEAEVHGRRDTGFIIDGSVVDGCVMIVRRSALEDVGFSATLPPHHFYDRIISCQMMEAGYRIGILGIAFAHLNGQTANIQQGWQDLSREWFKSQMGIDTPQQWAEKRAAWVGKNNQPSAGKVPDQWDYAAYLEAEYQFLSEFRDQKRLIPCINGKKI